MTLLADITEYLGVSKPPEDRYEELFVSPAMPFHFSREPVSIPRVRYKGKKQIFPVYDQIEINEALANGGRYDILDWEGDVIQPSVLMKPFRYSILKTNVRFKQHSWRTKAGERFKYWYFTKYDEDTPVRFFSGDIDDHGDRDRLQDQVGKTMAMLDAVGLKPMWFTSPGDLYDGVHRQGLYFLVLLDQPMKVKDLRQNLDAFFKQHDLEDLEHCFVTKRRNFRLLGQEYVYPVDVDLDGTVHLLDPSLTPKEQFRLTVDLIENHSLSSLSALTKAAQVAPEDAQKRSGDIKRRKGGLRSFKQLDASDVFASACTFTRMTKNLVCPKAINQHPNDPTLQQIYAEELLVSLSPADSQTCSNPAALSSIIGRGLDYYRPRHKPLVSSKTAKKRKEKESQDLARFQPHKHQMIDLIYGVKKYAESLGITLSRDEIDILRRFFRLMQRFNGRVAAKVIYAGDDAITDQRRWFSLIRKLPVLEVLEEYDQGQHKCRQWGFTKEILQFLSSLLTPHKRHADSKITVGIHPSNTPPSPPFSLPKTTTEMTPERHPWLFPSTRLTKQKLKLLEDPVVPWEVAA